MITYSPNALDGSVKHLPTYSAADFTPGCAVLCRNTAPLVSLAYRLIAADVPCTVLGRNIGERLVTLIEKMKADNIPEMLKRLDAWKERETFLAMQRGVDPTAIEDQYTAICVLCQSQDEAAQSIRDLCARISLLFSDEATATKVVLSTIHKSKGLEWSKVFLLDWSLIPSKYAKQSWQQRQERNLQYVAVTRTRDALLFINSGAWKE